MVPSKCESSRALQFWLQWMAMIESFLLRIPIVLAILVLPVLALAHNGFELVFPFGGVELATSSFPIPYPAHDASSYGLRTLAWALRITTEDSYFRLSTILFCLVLWALGVLVWKKVGHRAGLVVLLIICLGPIGETMLGNLARPDVVFLAGSLLLGVWARSIPFGVGAALVMAAGNPEQAMVATACFILVALGLKAPGILKAAMSAFLTSVVAYVLILLALRHMGSVSRITYFTGFVRKSLTYFLESAPIALYAGFGLSMVMIAITITAIGRRRGALLILGAVVIPLFVTAVTLDQTRVLVPLSAAGVSAILVWSVPKCLKALDKLGYTSGAATLAILTILLPTMAVSYPGEILLPYKTLVELYFNPSAGS